MSKVSIIFFIEPITTINIITKTISQSVKHSDPGLRVLQTWMQDGD